MGAGRGAKGSRQGWEEANIPVSVLCFWYFSETLWETQMQDMFGEREENQACNVRNVSWEAKSFISGEWG